MNSFIDIKSTTLLNCFRWLCIAVLIGTAVGIIGSLFLLSLAWATQTRDNNHWLIAFLPLGGAFVGWLYHRYGERSIKGNNLLLEEFHSPKQLIPLRMAPLVYFGTIVTHLFGGSAGREGTAVQMGGAIADQLTKWFNFKREDRKLLLILGISAGFAAVFGTPVAGAVFALEVMVLGRTKYTAIFPSLLTAFIANYACHLLPVAHTHYLVTHIPDFSWSFALYSALAGVLFGLASWLFTKFLKIFGQQFAKIKNPVLRPFVGGVLLAAIVFIFGWFSYVGLGISTIVNAFEAPQPGYAFLLKLILTTFTLSAGFKGGEVTPLFFIGATLGNALALFIPMPMAVLAAMGFVSVFSGATNTPITCTLMGMELFGLSLFPYLAIACVVAYFFSGQKGIYSAQKHSYGKRYLYLKLLRAKQRN